MKLFCDEWFEGSIRNEPIEVRAVWASILAFAGRTGDGGVIKLPGCDLGFSDEQLSEVFNVPIATWLSVKERLSSHPDGERSNRIAVSSRNVITIINWCKYQSEYNRQKPYRLVTKSYKKLFVTKSTGDGYRENRIEGEVDLDLRTKDPLVRKKFFYTPEFDEFWKEYPRAVGKGEAFVEWQKVIAAGYPPQDIIDAAREYNAEMVKEQREERHIKHPCRFLKKDFWKDFCVDK